MAVFGRDSLITSLQTLALQPDIAKAYARRATREKYVVRPHKS